MLGSTWVSLPLIHLGRVCCSDAWASCVVAPETEIGPWLPVRDPRSPRCCTVPPPSNPSCSWPRIVIKLARASCSSCESSALSVAPQSPSMYLRGREQLRRIARDHFGDLAIGVELKVLRCPSTSSIVIMQRKALSTHQHLAKGELQGRVLAQAGLNIGLQCCTITDHAVGTRALRSRTSGEQ